MAITRFPNKTSSEVQGKKMETSVIAAPATGIAPASLQKQISVLLDRLRTTPEESPEYVAAAKEFDRLVWGA